ncbi:MAG: TonB-dependent receptor plug domain-containing protein, partial [Bacteroidetes bacterium]|nr:TonB-dependent receptor plug domain-containing protein [Bacteroidota bacterium]
MKLTAFLLLAACLQVSASGNAQSITLSEKNVSLQKVFKQIQRQAPYDFVYSSELLQQAGKVSIDVSNAGIEQVLQLCLKDKPLTYVIFEKTIVIKPKPAAPVPAPVAVEAVADPLTGLVQDETGKPVVNASVVVKWPNTSTGVYHSPIGTQTDSRGFFRLGPITGNAVLYVSSVGFSTVQMPVNADSKNLRIVLTILEKSLTDLVVTGYSTKKVSELTGAVQTISGNELRNGVSTVNTLAMLKGKASGTYIIESSSSAGSVTNRGQVFLRGQSTVADANNPNFGPLIVLDGVVTNALNLQDIVDASDIESITMLKDAASTSIYGSRAAQGVFVVTTRRGSAGKLSVNLSMNYGQVQNNRLVGYMNTPELVDHITKYMQALYNAPALNGGPNSLQTKYGTFQNYFNTTRTFTDADRNVNYDWSNSALFPNGHQKDINLSLASGTDKTKFFASGNWLRQDGTLLDDNLDRKNIRFNIDQKISSKLSVGMNINAILDKYTASSGENQSYVFLPWVSPYKADGTLADSVVNYAYTANGGRIASWYSDPL